VWAGFIWLSVGTNEHSNEIIKFLFYPIDAQLNIPRKLLKFTLKLTLKVFLRVSVLGIFNCASIG
jgi:hypothetical protein